MRGLLAEYGIGIPIHLSQLRRALQRVIEDNGPLPSRFGGYLFASLCEELCTLEARIAALEKQLDRILQQHRLCRRISAIEGVGQVIATAVIAAVADGRSFSDDRQFAVWIGLVPQQHPIGETQHLSWITKRGDPHLRMLLIHGSRLGRRIVISITVVWSRFH